MRSLLFLIASVAVLALSWAAETEGPVPETPKVDGATPTQSGHHYRMERLKKKVIVQIAKIKASRASEEVKRQEIKHLFDQVRHHEKSLQAPHTKVAHGRAQSHAKAAAQKETAETPKERREEIAQTMQNLGKQVGNFKEQSHRRLRKRRSQGGPTLRRLSEETAQEGQGPRRQRRALPAKQTRTSFARAV